MEIRLENKYDDDDYTKVIYMCDIWCIHLKLRCIQSIYFEILF